MISPRRQQKLRSVFTGDRTSEVNLKSSLSKKEREGRSSWTRKEQAEQEEEQKKK